MSLRAFYRATEDRIELFLGDETETTVCWVSRRQWLGLLHRLVNMVLTEDGIKATSARTRRHNLQPTSKHTSDAGLVKSIRVQQTQEQMTLFFSLGTSVRSVKLNATQLRALTALLEKQASLAGWDAPAALRRYRAASMTRDALGKASGQSKDFT